MSDRLLKESDVIREVESLLVSDEMRHLNDLEYGNNQALYHVIDRIEDLPSADRWIPCSERLPSENGDYLVTLENGVVKILGYSTTQRTTYPKGFYYIKEGFSWRQVQNPVIAWMPLSKPWKGADDE